MNQIIIDTEFSPQGSPESGALGRLVRHKRWGNHKINKKAIKNHCKAPYPSTNDSEESSSDHRDAAHKESPKYGEHFNFLSVKALNVNPLSSTFLSY